MAKKKIEHGPLYAHAKAELERGGISSGKGNMDQTLHHTVLKLIDTFERGTATELMAEAVRNIFVPLSRGDIINDPTDDPDEWKLMPGLGEGVMILRRCGSFRSRDGGVTWYREDTGQSGISKVVTEGSHNADQEDSEDVQPTKG